MTIFIRFISQSYQ